MKSKAKLVWVSVGGNPCEPARLFDGLVYTIGCQDGHPLDGIEVVEDIDLNDIPQTKGEKAKAERAFRRAQALAPKSYRRFE